MPFRMVEISHPAEVHVKQGQLVIEQEAGTASIPLDDLELVVADGPGIRLSTMAQTMLAQRNIMVVLMGRNHLPAALTIPMVANARLARVSANQVALTDGQRDRLWQAIVRRKIENQARVLAKLGREGAEDVLSYSESLLPGDPDCCEGQAAREYFDYLQPGLNRRKPSPLNSALNYGYAIVRSMVARSLVTTGFIPALGIHHRSQLNAFNLADDVIEPFRPCVDLVAIELAPATEALDSRQRKILRQVLENAVLVNTQEMQVQTAIDVCADSLKRAIAEDDCRKVALPIVMPIKHLPSIRS